MPVVNDLKGPAGRLEALLDGPDTEGPVRAAVVFAHPHPQFGGTMHTKTVFQGAKALARIGCAVLRFNFRGVGASEGAFDRGEGEKEDFRAALDFMEAHYPGAKIWAAGFSFGSWVALEVGAVDPRVSVLIGIAPPVMTSVSGHDYDFTNTLDEHQAQVLRPGRGRRGLPGRGHVEVLRLARGAEGTGRHRRRGSPVRRQDRGGRRSARRSARRFFES